MKNTLQAQMRHNISKITFLLLLLSIFNYAEAKEPYKNAVKLTFLSWTSGSTKISYERAFTDIKQSAELCGSVIGAGYDKYHNDPLGFTVRYGHKFFVAGYKPEKPLPRGNGSDLVTSGFLSWRRGPWRRRLAINSFCRFTMRFA